MRSCWTGKTTDKLYECNGQMRRDPTARSGGAPARDEHRCPHLTVKRERCGKWRVKGTKYCTYHNRYHHGIKSARWQKEKGSLIGFYAKNAGPALRALLEELATHGDARLSLSGEVDAARLMSLRAFILYDAAVSQPDVKEELKIAAAASLRAAIEAVGDLAVRAAKINSLSSDAVKVEAIGYVVEQVTKIIETTIRAHRPDLADIVVAQLKELRLPTAAIRDPVKAEEFL